MSRLDVSFSFYESKIFEWYVVEVSVIDIGNIINTISVLEGCEMWGHHIFKDASRVLSKLMAV